MPASAPKARNMPIASETALYPPIKQFLEEQGYEVRGEVQGCDLVAVRGHDLIVVELKSRMNLTLVLQGVERLRLTDLVYLAIVAPRRSEYSHWHAAQMLCRRLGLGLLTVAFPARGQGAPKVNVICDPAPYKPRPAPKRRQRLLGEFRQRTGDYNVGGSTKRPIVTAYREDALRLACGLKDGPRKVGELREETGCTKTGGILQKNFYGWFSPVSRGVYQLTPKGEEALALYAQIIEGWKK